MTQTFNFSLLTGWMRSSSYLVLRMRWVLTPSTVTMLRWRTTATSKRFQSYLLELKMLSVKVTRVWLMTLGRASLPAILNGVLIMKHAPHMGSMSKECFKTVGYFSFLSLCNDIKTLTFFCILEKSQQNLFFYWRQVLN